VMSTSRRQSAGLVKEPAACMPTAEHFCPWIDDVVRMTIGKYRRSTFGATWVHASSIGCYTSRRAGETGVFLLSSGLSGSVTIPVATVASDEGGDAGSRTERRCAPQDHD
jgi:hypothetical protein